jgi:hypothetical protein
MLVFGALSVLLVFAILLGAKLAPGTSPASALADYPVLVTPTIQATKPIGLKGPQPTKQANTVPTSVSSVYPAPQTYPTPAAYPVPATPPQIHKPWPTSVVLENGWHLFTDPTAGYSISYPSNVLISVGQNSAGPDVRVSLGLKTFDAPGGYFGMFIHAIDNLDERTIESILVNRYKKLYPDLSIDKVRESWIPFKIGTINAYKVTFQPPFTIFIPLKDKIILVEPQRDWEKVGTDEKTIDPQAMELFDQILTTFSALP